MRRRKPICCYAGDGNRNDRRHKNGATRYASRCCGWRSRSCFLLAAAAAPCGGGYGNIGCIWWADVWLSCDASRQSQAPAPGMPADGKARPWSVGVTYVVPSRWLAFFQLCVWPNGSVVSVCQVVLRWGVVTCATRRRGCEFRPGGRTVSVVVSCARIESDAVPGS